jgi:hypothetical protein
MLGGAVIIHMGPVTSIAYQDCATKRAPERSLRGVSCPKRLRGKLRLNATLRSALAFSSGSPDVESAKQNALGHGESHKKNDAGLV